MRGQTLHTRGCTRGGGGNKIPAAWGVKIGTHTHPPPLKTAFQPEMGGEGRGTKFFPGLYSAKEPVSAFLLSAFNLKPFYEPIPY